MHHEANPISLGMTYEGRDPELLARILPLIDYIEVTPDSIAEVQSDGRVRLSRDVLTELENAAGQVDVVAHGIGLSIGTQTGWNDLYFQLLDQLLNRVPIAWHSEHLGYTTVDGQALGTMLALPRTWETLDMICERTAAIQARYPLPFLLENIVHILPDYPGELTDAAFLNALSRQTGCGLLLDIYNLECDAHNSAFDIAAFLNELELSRVRELHLACGVEEQGFLLDVHSRVTRPSTVALAQEALCRMPGALPAITYELLPEAIPSVGHDAIVTELTRLRAAFRDSSAREIMRERAWT